MATAKKAAKKSAGKKTAARKSTGAAKKTGARSAAKTGAGSRSGGAKSGGRASARSGAAGGAKRQPNAAFMKDMTPSPQLAAVVGTAPMPRTEVTKKIWDYIKKNKLQDALDKRSINADDKLKAVFGGKGKVSMFEMTKLVSGHLK